MINDETQRVIEAELDEREMLAGRLPRPDRAVTGAADPPSVVAPTVAASPAFFAVLEPNGRLVRFNEAVFRATGIDDDATQTTVTLTTLGEFDFGGGLAGPMTAHPRWDPTTGELSAAIANETIPIPPST